LCIKLVIWNKSILWCTVRKTWNFWKESVVTEKWRGTGHRYIYWCFSQKQNWTSAGKINLTAGKKAVYYFNLYLSKTSHAPLALTVVFPKGYVNADKWGIRGRALKPPSDVAMDFCLVNWDSLHIYSNVEFKNINANCSTLFNFKVTIFNLMEAIPLCDII